MFNQAYPEAPNEWVEWGFKHRSLPAGFWTNFKTQRDFAAWVEREKGMTSPRDWYSIRQKDLTELGGPFEMLILQFRSALNVIVGVSLLQRHYKGSVFALVKALRPDHKWLEWEFSQTPQGFWNNVQNQRRFLDWAGGELGVASMEDWYKISKAQVVKLGGSPLASGRWTHYCGFLFWFFFSWLMGITTIRLNVIWKVQLFFFEVYQGCVLRSSVG
jgi:hypothetical protein